MGTISDLDEMGGFWAELVDNKTLWQEQGAEVNTQTEMALG